ncbi:HTH-type transcriptional regulator MalT [Vibrio sp. 404]|uniref:HTH-type transcriptional regulator MalT n=1 Tax=Vibrio marinisediminis TaxID=2758441 RepID=A0A7W2ISG5_9VIBR|nr:HTH-type transcriptional regulator MalT [Vibrio marinisediminis]MBA5761320.1 HTH-type transcriptional regulator MalT [Vibrio marinisediminis]
MWIPSKLSCPTFSLSAIERPRIAHLLAATERQKLVLLRAPAGYGKTTVATQWLQEKPNLGWYNIDSNDNDPARFCCYFIAALNNATGQACQEALKLAQQQPFSSMMSVLTEALKQISNSNKQSYLVLDDYHHIEDDGIHQAIHYFLKHQPSHLTLVITSRSVLPLGIANLRVRGLITEIDQGLLAFDADEAATFFQQRIEQPLDNDEIERLYQYVEGWPSALELIAWQTRYQALAGNDFNQPTQPLNQAHLWDYLIEEVFTALDNDTQEFLLQCSVLERFNHTIAGVVTQRNDAQSKIESLQRYGLFIFPIPGVYNWFRFHSLFAEFLSHERDARLPHQHTELHQLAANAWLQQSNTHQALWHAKHARDEALTAHILCQHGWALFNSGDSASLQAALSTLSDETIFQQPTLCLLHAWLAQSQHRHQDVDKILWQSENANVALTNSEQGEFNALKAQVAISKNQPLQALEFAELALSQVDGMAYHSRIVATSVIGEVNHVLGHLDRALPLMQQTEKLARQYQVHQHALWAILQQSEILTAKGYLQAAFDVQESGFKLIDDQQLNHLPLHEFLLRIRAQLFFSWNRLDDAEACANQALKLLNLQSEPLQLHSYALLARIALCRGEVDRTAKYIAEVECLLAQSSYHIDWCAHAYLAQLLYWQAKQNNSAIQLWLEGASQPEQACNHFSQMQWRNICRAQLYLGQYQQATQTLQRLQDDATSHQLIADTSRNAIMQSVMAIQTQTSPIAQQTLKTALMLTNQTAILGDYLYNIDELAPILQSAEFQSELDELTRFRANQLLKSITTTHRTRSAHFDENFIKQLVHHPQIPELVRNSPLTQREWQVLGLIYSGLSNEQIAHELDVAGTTIKTHIRNLYQKLNIANRKQAVSTAEKLVKLMGH